MSACYESFYSSQIYFYIEIIQFLVWPDNLLMFVSHSFYELAYTQKIIIFRVKDPAIIHQNSRFVAGEGYIIVICCRRSKAHFGREMDSRSIIFFNKIPLEMHMPE